MILSSSISRPICKDDLDYFSIFFTGIDIISSSNPFIQPWLQEVALSCTQSADLLLHAMSESLAPKHTALCVKHGQNPKVSRLRKSSLPILAPISMSISWGMPHFHGIAQFTNLARHRSSQILTSKRKRPSSEVLTHLIQSQTR